MFKEIVFNVCDDIICFTDKKVIENLTIKCLSTFFNLSKNIDELDDDNLKVNIVLNKKTKKRIKKLLSNEEEIDFINNYKKVLCYGFGQMIIENFSKNEER